MKIENTRTKEYLDKVLLRLTRDEAGELRDALKSLLAENGERDAGHVHVSNSDFTKEVTVMIDTP